MKTTTRLIAISAILPFLVACSEQPAVNQDEAHGHDHAHAHTGDEQNHPHTGHPHGSNEHASQGTAPSGAAPVSEEGTISAVGLVFDVPEGWVSQPPANMMRIAQLAVETEQGTCTAAFSVARGGADANVMRWAGQFSNPSGDVLRSREDTTIGGHNVTLVEMVGEYRGMGMAPAQSDTLMRAAIIQLKGEDQLFIKMTGPTPAMEPLANGWNTLITTLRDE